MKFKASSAHKTCFHTLKPCMISLKTLALASFFKFILYSTLSSKAVQRALNNKNKIQLKQKQNYRNIQLKNEIEQMVCLSFNSLLICWQSVNTERWNLISWFSNAKLWYTTCDQTNLLDIFPLIDELYTMHVTLKVEKVWNDSFFFSKIIKIQHLTMVCRFLFLKQQVKVVQTAASFCMPWSVHDKNNFKWSVNA